MSQMNLQSLLALDPVQPNVAPIGVDPQYNQSQFQGGHVQLGQAAQQIGPTGDEALYGALSEIAGGVAQGIDNFSKISSMIEKDKITKAETFVDEISADETLTPDQKQQKYDTYMRDVWTPVLGKTWKKGLNARVSQMWVSTDARNKFEASRWEKEYNAWKRTPANINRGETNELLREFNQIYLANNSSADNNDWFTGLSTKINTALDIDMAQKGRVSLNTAFTLANDVPNPEEWDFYQNSANMEFNAQFENRYKSFFELKRSLETTNNMEDAHTVVHAYLKDKLLSKEAQNKSEIHHRVVAEELDRLTLLKTQEVMGIIRKEQVVNLRRDAGQNILTNVIHHQNNKDTSSLLSGFVANLGNLPQAERFTTRNALMQTIWSGLSHGQSTKALAFQQLPLDEQLREVEGEFRKWYNEGENKKVFQAATQLDDAGVEQLLIDGKYMIVNDPKQGGVSVKQNYDSISNDGKRIHAVLPILASVRDISDQIDTFETNTAEKLGISVESFQNLVTLGTEKDATLEPSKLTYQWFLELSSEEQAALTDRGFTSQSFGLLEDMRLEYTQLKEKALEQIGLITKVDSSAETDAKLPVDITGKTEREVTSELITNPEARATVNTIISNPGLLQHASPATLDQAVRLVNAHSVLESEFTTYSTEHKNAGINLFRTRDGQPIVETSTLAEFITNRSKYVEGGSLTQEGKDQFMRVAFTMSKLTQMPDTNPDKAAVVGQLKELLVEVGNSGAAAFIESDPAKFYVLAAALRGVADGSPDRLQGSTLLGTDSELMKVFGALLANASNTADVTLDVSPGGPVSEAFRTASLDMVHRFSVALDIFTTPLAKAGSGNGLPLVPSSNPANNFPRPNKEMVTGFFIANTQAGPSSARSSQVTEALVKRLNFPRNRGETSEMQLNRFGQTMWRVTGRSLPAMDGVSNTMNVRVPTEDGFVFKQWSTMSAGDKISYYLAQLHATDADSTEALITGWLSMSANPAMAALHNMETFEATAGYITKEVLQFKALPSGERPAQHLKQSVVLLSEANWNWYGTWNEGAVGLTTATVPDGRYTTRSNLLADAMAAGGASAMVVDKPYIQPWYQPPQWKEAWIHTVDDKGEERSEVRKILVGNYANEDEYIIDMAITQELTPDKEGYNTYYAMAKRFGQIPVDDEAYIKTIHALEKGNLSGKPIAQYAVGDMMGRRRGVAEGIPYGVVVRPPVWEVLEEIHQKDITYDKRSIRVENGNLYFEVGKSAYLADVPQYDAKNGKLPSLPFSFQRGPLVTTDKKEVDILRAKQSYQLLELERKRNTARYAYETGRKEKPRSKK